ncbi:MAG: hypothetical protein R2818_05805 [Flavobacteriales bacterium]
MMKDHTDHQSMQHGAAGHDQHKPAHGMAGHDHHAMMIAADFRKRF